MSRTTIHLSKRIRSYDEVDQEDEKAKIKPESRRKKIVKIRRTIYGSEKDSSTSGVKWTNAKNQIQKLIGGKESKIFSIDEVKAN